MNRKRIVAFIVGVISAVFIAFPAYADDGTDGKVLVDDAVAVDMGERFFSTVVPDQQVTAADPIKLYNKDGQASGYVVHAYCDGTPYGYVVYDFDSDSGIAEFAYGEEATSPYMTSTELAPATRSGGEKKFYKLDMVTYALIDDETELGFTNFGEIVDAEAEGVTVNSASTRSSKPTSWNQCFVDATVVYKDYNVGQANAVSGYQTYSEPLVESTTGTYACVVSAMLTVSSHFVSTGGTSGLKSDYAELWNLSSTTVYKVENGISYGSTNMKNAGPAIVAYAKARGKNLNYANHFLFPGMNVYRDSIDDGNMSIFGAGLAADSDIGHAMAVTGYMTLNAKDGSGSLNCLSVCDGWNGNTRILNYDSSYYRDMTAIAIW